MSSQVFDPYDYGFHEDPYPTYAWLRAESPVHHAPADDLWVISRHADVRATMKDDATFSNRMGVSLDASAWNPEAHRAMSFLALDGAEQTRLRRLVSAAFTPRRVRELAPRIQELTDRYLADVLIASDEAGESDWIADLAGKVPMDVISEMIGVPAVDRAEIRRLADLTVHREGGVRDVPEAGITAAFALMAYFEDMIEQRRRTPVEDLTSALTVAEINGDWLEDQEIIAFLLLMVVAGNETTTKLLGNALFHLSADPVQQKELLAASDVEESAVAWVEETLRFDNSTQMLARYVTADVTIEDILVPGGSKLLMLLGSANRDERVFTDPATYNLKRPKAELDRSLSFGIGRHFCLGANLARLEARIVLAEVMRQVESFEVHADRAERVHSTSVRGFATLPTTFVRRAR